MCASNSGTPIIDGCSNESIVASLFKVHFEKACSNNSNIYNTNAKMTLDSKLDDNILHTKSDSIDKLLFTAELVGLSVASLHTGKAGGHDGLVTEHLTHCHPIIFATLARLFNFMLLHGYVPSAFGRGLMIPIPKDSTSKRALGVENFRGITLSPIISKVFEHCLLLVYKDYLHTSDRQFGFKKNISCTQAIYTVRHVIDHFVANGSTVNICCLDICKAFDKVNHYRLFSKLIDRNVPMCLNIEKLV